MAMAVDGSRVHLILRGWSLFGIPLPRSLGPRATAYETIQDGRFRFHVEIGLPWGALVVRYRGWLVRTDEPSQLSEAPAMLSASLAALTTSDGIA
jgi:hypothetical protein